MYLILTLWSMKNFLNTTWFSFAVLFDLKHAFHRKFFHSAEYQLSESIVFFFNKNQIAVDYTLVGVVYKL